MFRELHMTDNVRDILVFRVFAIKLVGDTSQTARQTVRQTGIETDDSMQSVMRLYQEAKCNKSN